VNAHFQNRVAEQQIRDLSDGARTSLLHAKERWNSAISVHLWPYTVRHRNDVYNSTSKGTQRASPIELFSNMTIIPRLKHFHPFGCPMYRLNRLLQGGKSQPKWEQGLQLVTYLGRLPNHASSVALVMDLETAHVSPQFHLKFDNLFETVSPTRVNPQARKLAWQKLCHFGKSVKKATAEKGMGPSTSGRDTGTEEQVSQPMRSHGEAVKRIGRYLLGTQDKGFIVQPDMQKSFKCYVDADYCGNRDPTHSEDPNSVKSQTGYIIMYHGCPILWALRLQSVFALSTTEAEYVALSTALRDVIPVIDLLREMQDHGYNVDRTPSIKCKLFEDNSGAFKQAKTAKYRLRTRHINAAWHHFRSYVAKGLIQIHSI
jgi:hypothetical protein